MSSLSSSQRSVENHNHWPLQMFWQIFNRLRGRKHLWHLFNMTPAHVVSTLFKFACTPVLLHGATRAPGLHTQKKNALCKSDNWMLAATQLICASQNSAVQLWVYEVPYWVVTIFSLLINQYLFMWPFTTQRWPNSIDSIWFLLSQRTDS